MIRDVAGTGRLAKKGLGWNPFPWSLITLKTEVEMQREALTASLGEGGTLAPEQRQLTMA